MKMTSLNHCKYLLIDCGNSYLKMAIYQDGKELEFVQIPSKNNILEGLNQFKDCNKISKVFILTNGRFENQLLVLKAKFAKAEFKILSSNDFKPILDLSNIDKDVVIGNDILLLSYWASKQKDVKAVICLGTVYFASIINKKQIKSVLLLPSYVKGLEQIEHTTSIPSNLIPTQFDKIIGLNTPDAFASGLNISISGFIKEIIKTYKLTIDQIVITGGDVLKYSTLKKYKIIEHLTIKSLNLLIKEKHW